MSELKIGDKVEVVGYGHPIWVHKEMWKKGFEAGLTRKEKPTHILFEDATTYQYDMSPNLVGKKGIIIEISDSQGEPSYSISGIPQKQAWYNKDQLKLLTANQSTLKE